MLMRSNWIGHSLMLVEVIYCLSGTQAVGQTFHISDVMAKEWKDTKAGHWECNSYRDMGSSTGVCEHEISPFDCKALYCPPESDGAKWVPDPNPTKRLAPPPNTRMESSESLTPAPGFVWSYPHSNSNFDVKVRDDLERVGTTADGRPTFRPKATFKWLGDPGTLATESELEEDWVHRNVSRYIEAAQAHFESFKKGPAKVINGGRVWDASGEGPVPSDTCSVTELRSVVVFACTLRPDIDYIGVRFGKIVKYVKEVLPSDWKEVLAPSGRQRGLPEWISQPYATAFESSDGIRGDIWVEGSLGEYQTHYSMSVPRNLIERRPGYDPREPTLSPTQ
jgi:hypothetical protein